MDYEKKYNEALAWMRELYPELHGATKEDAEHYFPELRESEDERIRKELLGEIEFITPRDGETDSEGLILPSYHARIDRYKSYLEKQKEQKPESCDCSRDEESYTNGIHHVLMNPEAYGLIKQKPAEKQDYSGLTDLERAIHRCFLSAGVENVPVTIIKETAKECKRTQTIANENAGEDER